MSAIQAPATTCSLCLLNGVFSGGRRRTNHNRECNEFPRLLRRLRFVTPSGSSFRFFGGPEGRPVIQETGASCD